MAANVLPDYIMFALLIISFLAAVFLRYPEES